MNKKVGIITFFGNNYGACLQAYAVQQIIDSFENISEIINYTPHNQKETNKLKKYFKKLTYVLKHPIKYLRTKYWHLQHRTDLLKRNECFRKFTETYLKITPQSYRDAEQLKNADLPYEIYTTGSDQLWNPTHHKANPVYLLDFVPDGKLRMAFAPSIARKTIPDEYKNEFRKMLEKFDYLSVREDIHVSTIKELTPNKDIVHLLDPTLLLSNETWDKIVGTPLINEPYIFCYLFGDLKYIEKFVKHIKMNTGLQIISLPYDIREMSNSNIRLIYDAGPVEFVNLIKNASIIITDSFHATAFSINYCKPFYTLLRQNDANPDNMNSRFTSILKLVNLENRLILPGSEFPKENFFEIDYIDVISRLNKERIKSIEYLKKGLM